MGSGIVATGGGNVNARPRIATDAANFIL